MMIRHLTRPFSFCFLFLCVLAIWPFSIANAQSVSSSPSEAITGWGRAYASCFDRRGNLLRPQFATFLSRLEKEYYQAGYLHNDADNSYLLFLLANAYTDSGDWQRARETNLHLIRVGATSQHREAAYWNMAGISAMQGRWNLARIYYGRLLGNHLLYDVTPMILLCLGVLVLWRVGRRVASPSRVASKPMRRLVLFAFLPGIFALFWSVGRPINSLLLAGNAGAAFVSYRSEKTVGLALSIEWAILSLLMAYWVRKQRWIDREIPNPEQVASEVETAEKKPNRAKQHLVVIGRYLIIVGMGLWIIRASSMPVTYVVQNWSGYVNAARHNARMDVFSVVTLLSTSVLSPIAQEILFRGTLYAYARQVGGIGFGLAFSSITFAATHLQATDQLSPFVVAGFIFACQYEFTRRLMPSIATHSITNFLAFLSRAGSP